jgi:hypothetical protein
MTFAAALKATFAADPISAFYHRGISFITFAVALIIARIIECPSLFRSRLSEYIYLFIRCCCLG